MPKGKVVMTFDAETAAFVQKAMRAKDAVDDLERKAESMKAKGKRSFDASVESLTKVAAGWFGVSQAIGVATKALDSYEEKRKRASQTGRENEMALGQLAQLSGGSGAEMRRMMAGARASVRGEGMSIEQAAGLQFSLESMGKGNQRGLYARFHGIADPKSLVESVSTMQAAMGTQETGGDLQVLAKLFAASAQSKTTLQEFAPAATMAAKTAQLVGGTDEEVLGALASLSKSTKSADVAGTQIDAFARALIGKKEFEGMGIMGAAQAIQAKGWSNARIRKFFGRVEGFKGYQNIISQRGEIEGNIAAMNQAGAAPEDYLAGIISSREADPMMRQLRRTRIAEGREQLGEMGVLGEDQLAREEAQAYLRQKHRGRNWAYQFSAETHAGLQSWVGTDADTMVEHGGAFFDVGYQGDANWRNQIQNNEQQRLARELRGMREEYKHVQTPKRTSAAE